MKKLIKVITGLIAGLCPLPLAIIIGVFSYNELHNFIGISIAILLLGAAIWVGIEIFKTIQRQGVLRFLTHVNASSDLDNLKGVD